MFVLAYEVDLRTPKHSGALTQFPQFNSGGPLVGALHPEGHSDRSQRSAFTTDSDSLEPEVLEFQSVTAPDAGFDSRLHENLTPRLSTNALGKELLEVPSTIGALSSFCGSVALPIARANTSLYRSLCSRPDGVFFEQGDTYTKKSGCRVSWHISSRPSRGGASTMPLSLWRPLPSLFGINRQDKGWLFVGVSAPAMARADRAQLIEIAAALHLAAVLGRASEKERVWIDVEGPTGYGLRVTGKDDHSPNMESRSNDLALWRPPPRCRGRRAPRARLRPYGATDSVCECRAQS